MSKKRLSTAAKKKDAKETHPPLTKSNISKRIKSNHHDAKDELQRHVMTFLKARQHHSDNVFQNAIQHFVLQMHSSSDEHNDDDDDEDSQSQSQSQSQDHHSKKHFMFQDSIEYLTQYLKQDMSISHNNAESFVITKQQVASLLFPWAIQTLLYETKENKTSSSSSFPMDHIWNALASSYHTLSFENASEGHYYIILQNLSQGSLNKIVPFALKMAFHHEQAKEKDLSSVTTCLLWMIQLDIYRPTMEHICTTLFPLLESLLTNNSQGTMIHEHGINTNQYKILCNIMTMVHSRLESRCSNPKKTFQMMSSEECIISISHIFHVCSSKERLDDNDHVQDMIRKIVRLAFFDAQYHLDGFRSMNLPVPCLNEDIQQLNIVSKSKDIVKQGNTITSHEQSYQKGLLQSLENILSSIVDKNERTNSIHVMTLLPILLEEFILVTSKMDEVSHRKSRVDATAKIQLRLWAHVMQPILQRFTNATGTVTNEMRLELITVHQSLELLLKYDCYLPSFLDPNNDHIHYLEAVGETLLCLAEKVNNQDRIEILKQFEILLNLNHHIYHTKLIRVICAATSSSNINQQVDLLCYLCETYEKLRQIHYFLDCMIQSKIKNDFLTSRLINQDRFQLVLIKTIKSVPQGQLKDLFSLMDGYSLKVKKKYDGSLDFVVDLYVTILKGINVHEFNAVLIQSLCNHSERNVIPELLVKKNDDMLDLDSTSTINGLHLLGWIIRLNTSSIFWLNDLENADTYLELHLDIIHVLTKFNVNTKHKHPETLGALQHLACHRLIQLHSLIFQIEQAEGILGHRRDESNNRNSESLIADARALADYIIDSASARCIHDYRRTSWKFVCENIGIISIYANESQISTFLNWFYETLALDNSSLETAYQEEKHAIEILLSDVTFFEIPFLYEKSINSAFSNIDQILLGLHITYPILSFGDCCTQLHRIFNSSPDAIDRPLAAPISRILQFVISVRSNHLRSVDLYTIICGVLLISFRAMKTLVAGSFHQEIFELLQSCNSLLLSTVKHVYHESTRESSITKILLTHFEDMFQVILQPKFDNYKAISKVIHTGSMVVAQVVNLCGIHEVEQIYVEICSSLFKNTEGDLTGLKVLIIFATECARLTYQNLDAPSRDSDRVSRACHMLRMLNDVISALVDNQAAIDNLLTIILPFAAETFSLGKLLGDIEVESFDMDALNTRSLFFLRKVLSLLKDTHDSIDDYESSCLYYLTSIFGRKLLENKIPLDMKIEVQHLVLLQYIKRSGRIHPLLDTIYSSMCSQSSVYELKCLGTDLTSRVEKDDSNIGSNDLSSILYCFHIMILSASELEKVKVIAHNLHHLIGPSFHLLKPEDCSESKILWSLQIQRIIGLLQTVMSKSDVFVIKGHDYASIFSALDSILLGKCAKDDKTIFIMACELVSSMLKVNRKLIYGCVPSLTNTLRCILNYAMKLVSSQADETETEIDDCIHAVVRLFQLIPDHKEVFKKHMMYLVLYFVEGAQFTMNLWIKLQLQPVLYSLLDTLSEFELKQLGTLMQPSVQATFQTFFKNYKKNKFDGAY